MVFHDAEWMAEQYFCSPKRYLEKSWADKMFRGRIRLRFAHSADRPAQHVTLKPCFRKAIQYGADDCLTRVAE